MKSKTPIERITERMNEILASRKTTMDKYNGIIQKAEMQKKVAEEDMQKAVDDESVKAYKNAHDRLDDANSIIQMYS